MPIATLPFDAPFRPLMRGVIEGASAVGARLVYGDNLYAYGRVSGPLTEDLPYKPVSPNTRTRAEVAEADSSGANPLRCWGTRTFLIR